MTSTMKKVRAAFDASTGTRVDSVGKLKNGNFVARREFFYTHGYTSEMFGVAVLSALTAAGLKVEVVKKYEKWTPFRGGASVSKSSHWGVEFKVID